MLGIKWKSAEGNSMGSLVDEHNKRDQIIKSLTPGYGQCSRCKKFLPKQVLNHCGGVKKLGGKLEFWFLCPFCSKEEDDKFWK